MLKEDTSQIRKILILFFNVFFYCCLDLKSFPLLFILILFSYLCSRSNKNKKNITILSIVFTILVWTIYKLYIKMLPLGLSFYSFKIISYIIDDYKGKINFKKSFINYFIYVTYFPQILSGPISKANNIVNQLEKAFIFNKDNWIKGLQLIISGLFLKLVIANRAAIYVNNVFDNFTSCNGLSLFIAAFLYSIQIYGDFSGYSNISIGVSTLLGINCDRNFNRPYFSKNIKEFWNRWHISLSTWLKDYIYIPLGGSRCSRLKKFRNTMITFLVSGFWHGNGSGYIFWGFYHGILNNFKIPKYKNKFQIISYNLLTFIEVTIGWIFFRLEDFGKGIQFITHMILNFKLNYNSIVSSVLPFTNDNSSIAMAIMLFIFVLIQFIIEMKNIEDYSKIKYSFRLVFYIISIILFGVFGVNKFIYMNY